MAESLYKPFFYEPDGADNGVLLAPPCIQNGRKVLSLPIWQDELSERLREGSPNNPVYSPHLQEARTISDLLPLENPDVYTYAIISTDRSIPELHKRPLIGVAALALRHSIVPRGLRGKRNRIQGDIAETRYFGPHGTEEHVYVAKCLANLHLRGTDGRPPLMQLSTNRYENYQTFPHIKTEPKTGNHVAYQPNDDPDRRHFHLRSTQPLD